MNDLLLIPEHLRSRSIKADEIILPLAAALEAIDFLEKRGLRIGGWEGWIRTAEGSKGFASCQGTDNLNGLSVREAAQFCRETMLISAAEWAAENPDTTDELHFCITVAV